MEWGHVVNTEEYSQTCFDAEPLLHVILIHVAIVLMTETISSVFLL